MTDAAMPPTDGSRFPERDALLLEERRRSSRRRLREPAQVVLSAQHAGRAWRCNATLLNLSGEGMACRLSKAATEPLRVGDTLRAAICIAQSTGVLALHARAISFTPAADAGQLVVGLEFIKDDAFEVVRDQLQRAIQSDAPFSD